MDDGCRGARHAALVVMGPKQGGAQAQVATCRVGAVGPGQPCRGCELHLKVWYSRPASWLVVNMFVAGVKYVCMTDVGDAHHTVSTVYASALAFGAVRYYLMRRKVREWVLRGLFPAHAAKGAVQKVRNAVATGGWLSIRSHAVALSGRCKSETIRDSRQLTRHVCAFPRLQTFNGLDLWLVIDNTLHAVSRRAEAIVSVKQYVRCALQHVAVDCHRGSRCSEFTVTVVVSLGPSRGRSTRVGDSSR